MILSLYMMVICFCVYDFLPEDVKIFAILFAVLFFWIANACYDRTITKLKDEIRELRKEIERIK